ncbi:mucin-5AC [Xenopus laevis]|uniref:Mucin-5AC n=1 Tax=Xenopus laevis TaxID=8355 RepID=A0A8J0V4X5_XENLA|nr:mucin-5AC [Xenopus laevis]
MAPKNHAAGIPADGAESDLAAQLRIQKSTYEDFIVQIQNTMENGIIHTKIIMKINIMIVELFNDTVLVNGELMDLPYSSSGVMINKMGVYTKLTSKIGLEFDLNDDGSLMLRLDEKYSNQTCGLCGDYNGISKYNEFISSSGYEIGETEFGNLQKVNVPNEQCEDVTAPKWESCNETGDICAYILTGSSFADCLSILPIDAYVYSCMQDLCTCKENISSDCICSTIAEYSRQCIRNGGKPENWRTQELCPKTCPLILEYKECGPSCRDSCSNPERGSICENRCVEGCFCPSGMVLDDIQYEGCVNIDQCACSYNGNVFLPGETRSTSCSSCTCFSGKWNCTSTPCTSTCSIEGGSHFTTFDVTHFTVYGDCTYVLSKVCDGGNFTVLGEIRPCGRKDTETCLREVIIILNSGQTIIEVRPTGEVYVNFLYTFLPISSGNFNMLQPSPFYIVFDSNDGMQAIIQLIPVMQLYVVLDPIYKTRTCGICGNFNDIQTDDLRTISGVTEGTAAAFVNTWKTEAQCPSVRNILDDPCALSLENEDYAKHWCGLLTDPGNVFSQCHYDVNPNIFYKSCLTDTCSCEKSEECMCAALFSYVRACAAKGVILTDWNNLVCSNYKSICPENLVFSYVISTCPPTCRSLSISDVMCRVEFDPLMGCSCGKGLYLNDDGECVPPSFCPCYYRGSPINSGTTFNEGGVICTCTKGKLNCIGNEVAGKACVDPMVYISCNNSKPGTPGAECFKSCETLDMHCYSKRCSPGCVCPNGLVSDDKGGCINEIDCPCIHNEAMYAPGEEIKIRCNTCVCKDRMWNCTENGCLGTCKVYGDGHYVTFDGESYSFGGECEYTLAKDHCSLNDTGSTFRIITENIPCGTTGTTCSKSIKIFLEGYELILLDDHLNVIQRGNGTGVPYRVRLMGIYMVIETNQGLLLVWDKKTTIYIKVTNIFQGMLCGLCGNYDGNRNNDFTTRTNAVVGSVEEFANSWKLSLACPDAKLNKNPCALNPYRLSWAQKQCSIIHSNAFSACHPHVNPSPYYDNCVSDTCACNTGGDCECFCTAVAAYAQACGEFFICIYWRTPAICPLFCDYYNKEKRCQWHYRPCGAPCLKTCRNPSGKCSYELSGLEGCYPKCPKDAPFFDEDEMECVSQCGCFDEDRKYYKLGSKIPSKESCLDCNCTEQGIICLPNTEACICIYEGRMYHYNQTIYNTTDGIGGCITAICKENGTIHREIYPCQSAFTSPFTFSTVPTTAATNVTQMTTLCLVEQCEWSEWFNVSHPGAQNGDHEDESYQNIRANGYTICEDPKDIYCEADSSPVDLTSYNIICNVSVGLLCYKLSPSAPCPNYRIKVLCCSFVPCEYLTSTETTATETPSTTSNLTTTKVEIMTTKTSPRTPISISQRQPFSTVSYSTSVFCIPGCRWTQWFSLNSPLSGISGGDFENLKDIQSVSSVCMSPDNIECRAKNYPNTPLSQLGQNVICNIVDGLVCLNKDQNSLTCYDYEIRFYCCDDYSNCRTTARPTTGTTQKETSLSLYTTATTQTTKKFTILSTLSTRRTTGISSISPTTSTLISKSTSPTTKKISTTPTTIRTTKLSTTGPVKTSTKVTTAFTSPHCYCLVNGTAFSPVLFFNLNLQCNYESWIYWQLLSRNKYSDSVHDLKAVRNSLEFLLVLRKKRGSVGI